jgi:hypothetical protein
MNRKLLWLGLSIVTAMPLMIFERANTAVPPLSPKTLNILSNYIVIGKVTQIQRSEVKMKFGTNYHYKVWVNINQIESKERDVVPSNGQSTKFTKSPQSGSTIEVHYWTVGKRQGGWSGSQGENAHLKEGMTAKLFIRKDEQGKLHLLQPNGWEPIDRKQE